MPRRSPSYGTYDPDKSDSPRELSYDYSDLDFPPADHPSSRYKSAYDDPPLETYSPPGSRSYSTAVPLYKYKTIIADRHRPHKSEFEGPSSPLMDLPADIDVGASEEYLEASLVPSQHLSSPSASRKLLILDLNGTLLFRTASPPRRRKVFPYNPAEQGGPQTRTVYPRPYIPSFREYLFHEKTRSWLDTMVWSSAQPRSVSDMVDKTFGELQQSLVAVWTREDMGLTPEQYHRKFQTTKDLSTPWTRLANTPAPLSHSASSTLLLDDSPLKARLQPWNHVCIPEYEKMKRSKDYAVWLGVPVESLEDPSGLASLSSAAGEESAAKKRRKEKKKEKRRQKRHGHEIDNENEEDLEVVSPPPATDIGRYDETLLAVIGILDSVKTQSNVAAWIRAGGLVRDLSQPRKEAEGDVGHADAGESGKGDMWFEDEKTMSFWIEKGRKALAELDIELASGIDTWNPNGGD